MFRPILLAALAPAAYLLLCACVGALAAYPLALALHGAVPLHVVIGRLSQGLLFVGIPPVMRGLGLRWADFGFPARPGLFLKQVAVGFGLGLAMLGLHAVALVLLDIRVPNPAKIATAAQIQQAALNALLTACAVALAEEPLFRGFFLGALNKAVPKLAAIAICGFYFALLHFLKTGIRPEFADIHWYTGLPVALDAFVQLPGRIQPDSFLALFIAGILLALLRLSGRDRLGYCIGLHAGWVFVIKFARALTKGNPNAELGFLVGGYDGVIGYLAAAWMAVLILGLGWWNRRAAF
ncbi:hypothetical protein SAMN02949497_3905 [Methylomagnum ishizawai]|uniref:CAAX prenyl protease 2/Lysostaphin resistance protein A-like domain-containing protein n=1 Tax=Methylomagnum ishizawai TaxID=1760988 RepID=A0A1Y6D9W3_9GAMM|nr:CPBP family intramembrane glutamic endopeptidase [Methylomagnum ishizawai]SMF96505.1 hypothetical protein SAMN02949497_3905 [Methylomagnum ishizawai]